MAIARTSYMVSIQNNPYEIVVEYDHNDDELPVGIGPDDNKQWLSISEAEQVRRDLGAAIRQAKDAR